MTRTRRSARDERGTMLVEFTWLAILLLIPLVYLLISVFEVQRGAFAVTTAARSAGRAYALAPSAQEARSRAEAAVRTALEDQGLDGDDHSLEVRCRPDPHACLTPGTTITVVVRSEVSLPLMPAVLTGSAPRVRVEAAHSVPRGRYRSR